MEIFRLEGRKCNNWNRPWQSRKCSPQSGTALRAERCEVRVATGAGKFHVPENVQTGPEAHPAYCVLVTGSSCPWIKMRDVRPTAHRKLIPKLRMNGAIPLLPLYSLMECKGTTLPLRLYTEKMEWRIWSMSGWRRNTDWRGGKSFECKKADKPGDQIKKERGGECSMYGG